jgi:hypothetical protein
MVNDRIDAEEFKRLIKGINESGLSDEDKMKLIDIVKKSTTLNKYIQGVGPVSSDVLQFGDYEIGRDVFEAWHQCKYLSKDHTRCNYHNVISEFDPENPPYCQNQKIEEHKFTPYWEK